MRSDEKIASRSLSTRVVTRLDAVSRRITAPLRCYPDAVVIGAQRAGTTSLFDYMVQHPEVHGPTVKEIHYFDIFYDKGVAWYRAHFPLQWHVRPPHVTVEASPYYLFHPYAPARLAQHLPDAKLIVLLRNPVERALSHYFLEVKLQREPLSLREALAAEQERLSAERERMKQDPLYYSRVHQWFSYCTRGVYVNSLRAYDAYKNAGRLLILQSETFFAHPHDTMRKVFAYLGVDENYTCPDVQPRNVGTNRTRVAPEDYTYLTDYFAPYNEELYAYIGERFDW